jgi:hypothetical protein
LNCLEILKKNVTIKFNETGSVEAELFHAGGRTDRQTGLTNNVISEQDFSRSQSKNKIITKLGLTVKTLPRDCYLVTSCYVNVPQQQQRIVGIAH